MPLVSCHSSNTPPASGAPVSAFVFSTRTSPVTGGTGASAAVVCTPAAAFCAVSTSGPNTGFAGSW